MSPDLLRPLILLAVFAAVLLLAEALISSWRVSRAGSRAVNQRLQLIAKHENPNAGYVRLRRTVSRYEHLPPPIARMGARFSALVISAGIKARPSVILAVACAVFITCFALGLILVALPMGSLSSNKILMLATFAAAVSFALPLLYLIRLSERRKKKLVEQFPMALDVLVRSLRAGHPTLSALQIVSSELSDPLGSEFGLALDEVNYGADVRDALQNMADRCDSEDIQIFVVCLSVQAETGGNLAEILAGLAAVIRERISMLMKVRALSSEGRMTGVMLTALPIVTFVGLFLLNPGFYLDISGDPAFLPGFGGLLLSFIVGSLWIRRLVNLKV